MSFVHSGKIRNLIVINAKEMLLFCSAKPYAYSHYALYPYYPSGAFQVRIIFSRQINGHTVKKIFEFYIDDKVLHIQSTL